MDFFPFEIAIFPQGALSSSVITTVWVGVIVVAFLNLRFGTTLSGLVVPGYLVPLLLLRPVSALVVVGEGIVTYFLAVLLAEKLPRWLNYSEFFGRDRFFAMILLSIAVRLMFDGYMLPNLADYLLSAGIEYDYRNNLHSFGLIIVALIANQMWNGGFRLGISSLVIYTAITYILVRFVLMNVTNFNISTMSYMYEDLATSILASPKAYIILLTSAFIASRLNLQYGWEFNGILIPSLLALQWYQPSKLLITFVEAFIIYAMAIFLLRAPWMKNQNFEGARQILLFFNIGFIYKITIGFLLIHYFPTQKVSDFFAFGYLLSTLIALKMFQKDIAIQMTRATLQASFMAVISASVIGYFLTLLPLGKSVDQQDIKNSEYQIVKHDETFQSVINRFRSSLYASTQTQFSSQATPVELDTIAQAFRLIAAYLKLQDRDLLLQAQQLFSQVNMQLHRVENHLVLEDAIASRGWGIFAWNIKADIPLVIEVPAPLDELQAADAAIPYYLKSGAKALALAGTRRKQAVDGSTDSLANSQTPFMLFHRVFAIQSSLQMRQYTGESRRVLLGLPSSTMNNSDALDQNQLWIKDQLPEGLNANQLQQELGDLTINWSANPLVNRQREQTMTGFSELFLSRQGIKRLLAYSNIADNFTEQFQDRRIDGYLLSTINETKDYIAGKGSNQYIPAKVYELLYFDQVILTPIFQLLREELSDGWNEEAKSELTRLNQLATALNYEIVRYFHQGTADNYLILQESQSRRQKHWGTYVFRIGASTPLVIEIPRPLAEINTLEVGVGLFEKTNAEALLIAGAHPLANEDGSANVLSADFNTTLFNAVHQTLLRENRLKNQLVIQLRALASDRAVANMDVILAKLESTTGMNDSHLYDELMGALDDYGLKIQTSDGSEVTRGYEVSWNAQARYLPMADNKSFYTLWVSPLIRRAYRDQEENHQETMKFAALDIGSELVDLPAWFEQHKPLLGHSLIRNRRFIEEYLEGGNIVLLQRFILSNEEIAMRRLVDKNTRQSYLAMLIGDRLIGLVNLETFNSGVYSPPLPLNRASLQEYVDSRYRWLEWRQH